MTVTLSKTSESGFQQIKVVPTIPSLSGLTPKEEILNGMMLLNVMSMPFRAIDTTISEAVSRGCNSTQTSKKACEWTAEKMTSIMGLIPDNVKYSVSSTIEKLHQEVPEAFERDFGIAREETSYCLESVQILVEGVACAAIGGAAGKVAGSAVKHSKRLVNDLESSIPVMSKLTKCSRLDYSKDFKGGLEEFLNGKEFIGTLSKDRVIVRFHTESSISHRSWKWWTTSTEANLANTMEKIKNRLALLDSFGGEKTHVSVAVIPKGTKVHLYHGRAKPQEFVGNLKIGAPPEYRPGGGYQIRFKGFDERWIRETRLLDGPSKTLTAIPKYSTSVDAASIFGGIMVPAIGSANSAFQRVLMELNEEIPNQAISLSTSGGTSKQITGITTQDNSTDKANGQPSEQQTAKFTSGIIDTIRKIDEILPKDLEINITDSTHFKKMTVSVMHPVGEGIKVGMCISPNNLSHSSIQLSKELPHSTSVGLSLCPADPKQSTVSLSAKVEGVSGGIIVNPLKPKHSIVHVEGQVQNVGVGYSCSLRKPLQGHVSVSVPAPIGGLPFVAGLNLSLRKPLNSHLKLSLPIPGVQIPLLSISPKGITNPKSIGKKIEKGVRKIFGRRKKKKKHKLKTPQPLQNIGSILLTPANQRRVTQLKKELDAFHWGQFDEKIAKATEILSIKPDHSAALFSRGHAYYQKGKMDLAWKDISKAYEINPKDYWIVYYVGLTAHKLHDNSTAIEFITEAIKLSPTRYEPHDCLAQIYFEVNNFTKSIEHSNKAIQLNAEKAGTAKKYLTLSQKLLTLTQALSAFQWGQFDEKIAKATEILSIKPDHSAALFSRGHAYYQKGKMDLAWKDISKAYEINPKDYWIVYYVGLTAHKLHDNSTAIEFITEAIKLSPTRYEPHDCLAQIYFEVNNFTKSIEHSNKAIQLNAEKAGTAKKYLTLSQKLLTLTQALSAFQWGQFDEKIAKATEILSIKPDHSAALFSRGHAYYQKGKMDLAWKDISKAYEINPKDYWIVYYVGLTAHKLHDNSTAIEFITEAIKLSPTRYEPHDCLAQIYFEVNNFTKSIEHSNKAIQLNAEKAGTAKKYLTLSQKLLPSEQ